MNEENRKAPKRISQTVLNSLKGGVVPRIGLPYIAVGRKSEIEALLHDVDIISEDIPGWLVANEGNLTVALEVELTDELKNEGMA